MSADPEQLRRRLESDPTDEQAFAGLQAVYVEGGYDAELAELLEYRATYGVDGARSANLLVRSAELWLDRLGNRERGISALTRALEKEPMVQGAVERLEALYRERGDTAALMALFEQQLQALEAYDSGEAAAPLRAHYNQQLGEIWAQVYDRQDQAVFYFRRAFELDPRNVMALYCAREIYQKLGNHETATKLLDLEARAEPDAGRRVALYRELGHARAERLGDLEGAVVALKRALALEPSNADVMGELALLLLRRAPLGGGDADRQRAADLLYQVAALSEGEVALGYCDAALDAWPENEGALALFEQTCRETGRLELLADRYRRLLEPLAASPLLADVYRRAGQIAAELGAVDEAIDYFEGLLPVGEPADRQALADLYRRAGRGAQLADLLATELGGGAPAFGGEPAPVDPEALPRLRELAELLRAQGREEEAEARMLEIIELDPGDPDATSYLERRYRQRGDWDSLYALLSGAGGSQRLSAAARVVRLREAAGIAEERLGNVDGAIAAYKLAAILDAGDAELPRQLERLLIAAERWDDLIDRIETNAARAETPQEKIDLLRRIADIHQVRRTDPGAAADTFRRILELKPDDRAALESLDEIYLREGDWESLVTVLRRREALTAIGQEKAALSLRLASVLHEHLERTDEAFAACQQVLQHAPDNDEALRRMEAIDTISGNWKRLIETLRYRADVAEGDAAVDFLARAAAAAETHLEDFGFAAQIWQQVVDLRPNDVEALTAKATCLERAGRWDDALEGLAELAEAAEDAPVRLEARRRIARIHEERGGGAEAVAAWKEVVAETEDPEALEALAGHYERAGDNEQLAAILKRLAAVVEEPERHARVLLAQARLLAGPLGSPDEAIAALEHLLADVDPRSRDALRQLRRIHAERGDFVRATEAAEQEILVTENAAARTELLLTCASWYRNNLDDLQKAISANERVLEIDPYRTDVLAALEELYVETRDWERLLQLIRARYKASNDDDQKKHLLIAGAELCETQLQDGVRAWGWYRELFDVFGRQPEVLELVEAAGTRHGLARELVGVYGELAKRADSDLAQARWWKKIGALYADPIGDHGRALEAVLRGFALDPADRELLETIDDLAIRTGAHDRLVRVYDALVEREGDVRVQIALRRRAASALLKRSDDAGPGAGERAAHALSQLLEALRLDPQSDELLVEIEAAAEASKRWDDLLAIYDARREMTDDEGERIEMLLRSAQVVQEHLNAPDRAFGLVLEAVTIDPDDEHVATRSMQIVDGLERLAAARGRGRFWRQLIGTYRELVAKFDERPEDQVVYLEWIARIQQDYIQDGRAAFETRKEATLLHPGHKPSFVALERLAQRLGMWSDLAQHYRDALEVVLDREVAIDLHRRRARVLSEELNRPAEAVEHYWQLIQIDPSDAETRTRLSGIYARTSRWNDLMLLLEKELPQADEARQHEILLEMAGLWEQKLQNSFEALDTYRRVLARWPDDAIAIAGVDRLQRRPSQVADLDDTALAELGLLDDAEPPVFDDEPEPGPEEVEPEIEELEPEELEPDDVETNPKQARTLPRVAKLQPPPPPRLGAPPPLPPVARAAPPPAPPPRPAPAPPLAVRPVEPKVAAPPKGEPSSFDVSFEDVIAEAEDDVQEVDSLMLELDPEPSAPRPPAPTSNGKPSRPPPLPRK